MFSPTAAATALDASATTLARSGTIVGAVIAIAALATTVFALLPGRAVPLRRALVALLAALVAGEGLLIWFHIRLWTTCQVADPLTGVSSGSFAVPLWIESEKLYVWALIMAAIAVTVRRKGDELRPLLAVAAAALALGALVWGKPFAAPLPDFLGGYRAYLAAWSAGDSQAAFELARGLESSRQFYYNTWYMWAHPPLLFLSYGAFATSFAASLLMIVRRRSSYEDVAYRWVRLGYVPLTLGMVIGLPWAIIAWSGEAWWWSGKVNMSIMMWLLYTAYLHARLYLRRPGMWRVVAALAVLSFVALVLTYITTYVVPGAHSVA